MKLRRFNDDGIARVRQVLPEIEKTGNLDVSALIADEKLTIAIPELDSVDLDPDRTFQTTFAFCEYFHSLMKDHHPLNYRTDVGFWTWLAMVYLKQLVKINADGCVQAGDRSRFCYEAQSHMLAHRHLLASAYNFYLQYYDDLKVCRLLLQKDLNVYTMLSEELLSRQSVLYNKGFMMVADRLYYDEATDRPKKGCTVGPGSIRRLIALIDQLGMTRDFFEGDDATEFIALLPKEFERFIS